MRIEHIAMYVNDLEAARAFFENTSTENQMKDITMPGRVSNRILSLLKTVQGWRS